MKRKPREEVRRARNQVYREHILEAAEKVFSERGFESARVQEISRQAGLSMGTIYSIFAGKEEIFSALLEERGQALLELARDIARRNESAREALEDLIEGYVGYFVDHPTFLQMHLSLGTSWVLTPRPEGERRTRWEEIHELQASIFRRGVKEGVFVDEDPVFLAKMFSAMDQVVLSDWAAGGMKASREVLIDRMRAIAGRLFLRGGS